MEEIIIEIDTKTGIPKVSVNGVQGKACEGITAPIEAAFGGQMLAVEHTAEYTARPKQTERGGGRESSRERGSARG